jgi:hypothetical protein
MSPPSPWRRRRAGRSHALRRSRGTAIWLNVPLIANDAIFAKVKDLHLLTKLDL